MHRPHIMLVCLCAVFSALLSPLGHADALDAERAAFRDVWPDAELGIWDSAEAQSDLLEDYVLWPDLRAAYLRARLGKDDDADVREFLATWGTLKPARELRYRYALQLGKQQRHRGFLDLYEAHYAELGEPTLDCLAVLARIRLGDSDALDERATRLWLTGRNQVDQCDPVFAHMRNTGHLTPDLQRQRYALAIGQQQFPLARYIARSIGDPTLAEAERWLRANGNAERFLSRADTADDNPVYREQLAHAARRIGYREPLRSLELWRAVTTDADVDTGQDAGVHRHAALWAARLGLPEARTLLDAVPRGARDDEVRRWQIRTGLRQRDWPYVIAVIDALSLDERDREEWRFWRAIALENADDEAGAMLILSGLAERQSYHGFLAADHIGTDYALASDAAAADETIIADLASREALIRARELYKVGLDGRARSEWDAAVRRLATREKLQAAILAQRWDWHSRAIAVAAQAGETDDLRLRYPLPHREAFRRSATEAGIAVSWAYGVARSESLFMRDVRSSAGAIGLMQLIPSTGRRTAQQIRHPYHGRTTLIDPDSNIRLGTTYLGMMSERFGDHPALATAAYNAGPLRVEDWLPGAAPMDARVWVETIPFNQTRNYVRRVLASDVIFHWRLTGETRRLSGQLPQIVPPQKSAQLSAQ